MIFVLFCFFWALCESAALCTFKETNRCCWWWLLFWQERWWPLQALIVENERSQPQTNFLSSEFHALRVTVWLAFVFFCLFASDDDVLCIDAPASTLAAFLLFFVNVGELAQQCCSLSFVAVKFVAAFFVLQQVAGFRVFVYSVHGLWLSTVGKSSAQSDPMKLLVGVLLWHQVIWRSSLHLSLAMPTVDPASSPDFLRYTWCGVASVDLIC